MEYVEIARAETARGELVLRERRPEPGDTTPGGLELRANGVFVMDTVEVATERALATAALGLVESPRDVVVAGLGLGFTMHEVLADDRVERCAVVEVEDALVRWMRDGTVPQGPALLADERVSLVIADIAVAVAEARPASYDLVLLDVDNGPGYLVHETNAEIYQAPFLAGLRRMLRPGGAVAVWSAAPAPALMAALAEIYDDAEERPLDVRLQDRDEQYWLYVARVAPGAQRGPVSRTEVPSRHVSEVIRRPAAEVYAFASDPANLPAWAAGLAGGGITRDGDTLLVDSPMGRVTVRFVPSNDLGVLDHDVTLPSGTTVTNPVRVLAHPDGAEVVFTVRQIELTDDEFEADIRTVVADLARLRRLLEGQGPG